MERLLINLMENPTNARSFESGLAQGYTFAAQQSLAILMMLDIDSGDRHLSTQSRYWECLSGITI
ncbi:hypothetical protein DBB42_27525 [Pseudomonas plecoglossicida]|uniref:Uncharacterized protein n=1 Tax=Pseudomonas plecoglossicida TaxID=70775 RepID=A0A2R7UA39_PSEDL|nr:hypothetical protein DBB42_27525 [Pseudomonas plecoglossicida]